MQDNIKVHNPSEWTWFIAKMMFLCSVSVLGFSEQGQCAPWMPAAPTYLATAGIYISTFELVRFRTFADHPENKDSCTKQLMDAGGTFIIALWTWATIIATTTTESFPETPIGGIFPLNALQIAGCDDGYQQCTFELIVMWLLTHTFVVVYIWSNRLVSRGVRSFCALVVCIVRSCAAAARLALELFAGLHLLSGALLILVGLLGAGKCNAIPLLPTYCVVMGTCMCTHEVTTLGPMEGLMGVRSWAARLCMSVAVMSTASWGVVLSAPHVGSFHVLAVYVDGNAQCTLTLLYSSIVSATLVLFPFYYCLVAQAETLGRSRWQWRMFFLNASSLQLAQLGYEGRNDCEGIPSLPAYLMVFGMYNGLMEFFNLVTNAQRLDMGGTVVRTIADVAGLVLLLVVAWGTVLTISISGRFASLANFSNGAEHCSASLMLVAMFTVVIVWGSVLAVAIVTASNAQQAHGAQATAEPPKVSEAETAPKEIFHPATHSTVLVDKAQSRGASIVSQSEKMPRVTRASSLEQLSTTWHPTRKRSMSLPADLQPRADNLPTSVRFANGGVVAATRIFARYAPQRRAYHTIPESPFEINDVAHSSTKGATKGTNPAARTVQLHSWYPAIGLATFFFLLMQNPQISPLWAHPTPVKRLGRRGGYSLCKEHSDCFHLTECTGEGLRDLSWMHQNLFCYNYEGAPPDLVNICWSKVTDPL